MSRLSPAITTSYLGQHGEIALWRKRERGTWRWKKRGLYPSEREGPSLSSAARVSLKAHRISRPSAEYEDTRIRGCEDSRTRGYYQHPSVTSAGNCSTQKGGVLGGLGWFSGRRR